MSRISILDCTLRDGGYINGWNFGGAVIRHIIDNLARANVEIIECGFLRGVPYDPDLSVFSDMGQIADIIAPKKRNAMYVGMLAIGDMPVGDIPPRDDASLDGIRVTFHHHEWDAAMRAVEELAAKGYLIFVQPVGTTSYSDMDLLKLVEKANRVSPYALYVVDTLGTMYPNDLLRTWNLLDNNLDQDIVIGFHSHNNLQLSFSNAQSLLTLQTRRHTIIDASILGMGRAAGNLCTELIAQYVNQTIAPRYDIQPLLEIAENHLLPIQQATPWGYSLPYYLAAVNGVHPNYATDLLGRQTLDMKSMGILLDRIPPEKRPLYDRELSGRLYQEFQSHKADHGAALANLRKRLPADRPLMLLASGNSITEHRAAIDGFIADNNPFIISINFIPEHFRPDMVFFSNLKRFESIGDLRSATSLPLVVTSNILQQTADPDVIIADYATTLGYGGMVDNSGIMAIKLMEQAGHDVVHLAGFDGFSGNVQKNFYSRELFNSISPETAHELNITIRDELRKLSGRIGLRFVTPSRFGPG